MDITEILTNAVSKNASDVHLSSGKPLMFRIAGELANFDDKVLDHDALFNLLKPILSDKIKTVLDDKNEYDGSMSIKGLCRFRLHLFYQLEGISATFRIIPNQIQTLEAIKAPDVIKTLLNKDKGLILVTGRTGCGKSTTLASMINWINEHKKGHIITIEDPIEFVHPSKQCLVNQRQVKHHTKDFNSALKASLREDPDYLLIGELRDLESIRLALTASETGHLVLATMHTNSAAKAIDRLINVFDATEQALIRTMLSESLQAVIAQQLVKTNHIKREALFEVLVVTQPIKNLIRENKIAHINSAMQMGKKDGMQTMQQSLDRLNLDGFNFSL